MSISTRKQTTELTKAANGNWLMATWEWNNGYNLISTRPATEAEIMTIVIDTITKIDPTARPLILT